MIKKQFLVVVTLFLIISCSSNNDNIEPLAHLDENIITYQISNSNVFSTTPEQVKNADFKTITVKEGYMTSRLGSGLGKFEETKNLNLILQITRKTEFPKFEVGSFSLAGPEIMLNDFISPENTTFAVVNVLSIQEFEALKSLDKIEELKDKFVFHSNSENKLIIEKVEDRNKLENDAHGIFKIGSQLLEGYALIYLLEVNSNEIFSIRLDFSVINDIRLRI